MKCLMLFLFSFLVMGCVVPVDARVGAGGAYNGPAVGPRGGSVYGPNGGAVVGRPYGGCCYGGYNGYEIAGTSVQGASSSSTVQDTAAEETGGQNTTGKTVFVAPAPAGPAPAIGTIIYSLPTGCSPTVTSGNFYYQCGRAYYQTFYQAGTLVYQVVKAPY
jgi:hypothetical protein